MVDLAPRADRDAARARGEPVAGHRTRRSAFRDLKWLKPVYAGDTIDYTDRSDRDARLRQPPRARGLMTFRSTGVNQDGEPVISLVSTTFVERRGTPP